MSGLMNGSEMQSQSSSAQRGKEKTNDDLEDGSDSDLGDDLLPPEIKKLVMKKIDPLRRATLYEPIQQTKPKKEKLKQQEVPEYKANFLAEFLDVTETTIEREQQWEKMQQKMAKYKKPSGAQELPMP